MPLTGACGPSHCNASEHQAACRIYLRPTRPTIWSPLGRSPRAGRFTLITRPGHLLSDPLLNPISTTTPAGCFFPDVATHSRGAYWDLSSTRPVREVKDTKTMIGALSWNFASIAGIIHRGLLPPLFRDLPAPRPHC